MNEVLKGVNFPSYLFASLVAGYVMLGADLMLEGTLGLFGTYRYFIELTKGFGIMEGMEDLAMVIGHTADSVVLALFFVHPRIYRLIPSKGGALKGAVFGIAWSFLVEVVVFTLARLGSGFMEGFLNLPLRIHISIFLLHIIWGTVLGILYNPSKHVQ